MRVGLAGATVPPCPDGRYEFQLLHPYRPGPIIVLHHGLVAIESTCPPIVAELTSTMRGLRVRAAWSRCEGSLSGPVRLRARITGYCIRMAGVVRRGRERVTRRFVAVRKDACGDGVLEVGEWCDDGDTLNGDCCSVTCQIEGSCFVACHTNAECPSDAYCAKEDDDCDGSGACRKKPAACLLGSGGVCGCDGQRYEDKCAAIAAGANIASSGCE